MPNIFNRDFSGGWKPSMDSANAPPIVLLRSDNAELEDEGIVSLRPGLTVETSIVSGDIDVVKEVELNGHDVVLSATTSAAYADGTGLGFMLDGTGDPAIDTVDGHALISSGTTHKKYDGTTVREWGIDAPLEPAILAGSALTSKAIANFSQGSAEFAATEGTISYVTGYDGVANAATGLTPAVGSGAGDMSYTFSTVQNLLDFSGSEGGEFDLFEFWFVSPEPNKFLTLTIMFGLSTGTDPYDSDLYFYTFGSGLAPIAPAPAEIQQASVEQQAAGTAEDPVEPPPPEQAPQDTPSDPNRQVPHAPPEDPRRRQ